jgi:hypothetical protein
MELNPKKSRRPSAGPPAKPPEAAATFFVDRDTGGRLLAVELRNRGYTVVLHDDVFPQDTKDPFWIRSVAERGWLILTCDRNIARKEPERSLFGTAPTHTFILYALTQVKRTERIGLVLTVLPKLTKLVTEGARHGIYRVFSDGRVERVEVLQPKFRLEDF